MIYLLYPADDPPKLSLRLSFSIPHHSKYHPRPSLNWSSMSIPQKIPLFHLTMFSFCCRMHRISMVCGWILGGWFVVLAWEWIWIQLYALLHQTGRFVLSMCQSTSISRGKAWAWRDFVIFQQKKSGQNLYPKFRSLSPNPHLWSHPSNTIWTDWVKIPTPISKSPVKSPYRFRLVPWSKSQPMPYLPPAVWHCLDHNKNINFSI